LIVVSIIVLIVESTILTIAGRTVFLMIGIKAPAILEASEPERVISTLSGLMLTRAFWQARSGAFSLPTYCS